MLGLRGTGLAHEIMPWRDALHEGPVPDVADDELRRVRAAFLSGEGAADVGTVAEFEFRDRELEAHRDGAYVLWFEADVYDQLQLVQILARLRTLEVPPERITLVCVGEHVGIAHFGGLGELSSEQLARLPETVLTPAALDLAAWAWDALRAPDPSGLEAIAASRLPELRFLGEAYDRLGREYPSTRDGLALTERRILAAVAAGAATAGDAFVRAAAREVRPFLGDTWCFDRIARLSAAPEPLLDVSAPVLAQPRGDHRRGPERARRPRRPRGAQRRRPLDRRRPRDRGLAMGRGDRVGQSAQYMTWRPT